MYLAQIQEKIMRAKDKKYLEMHPNTIYQGKDGMWYTYLPGESGKRKKIRKRTKSLVEDSVIAFWKDQEENPTFGEIFCEWNELRLERNKIARSTYDRYKVVYNRHLKEFGKRRIRSLTAEDVEEFLEWEIARLNLTAKAFSNLKTAVVGTLRRAKRKKLLDFNINDMLDELDVSDNDFKKTIKEDYEEVFDETETAKVMQYCDENPDLRNTAILLMFVTGIRVGELVTLQHQDIHDGCISIRRTETVYKNPSGKGWVFTVKEFPKTKSGVREVVIPKDYQFLLTRLKRFNPFGEYIFTRTNGDRMTADAIRKRLRVICRDLDIYNKSPHKIRKTVTTIYMDNKLDSNIIKNQMGWSTIAVGENHYHRNRKTVDKKIDIVSSIPEFQRKMPR